MPIAMPIDWVSALVRSLSFIALFQAAGGAIFIAVFGRELATTDAPVRRLGFLSAIAAAGLVSAHYGLEAARMAGEFSGAFDPSLQLLVLDSPMSVAGALRVTGLLVM